MSILGNRVVRVEDPRFLRGEGLYVENLALEGALWATFVRSPLAHARVSGVDASAAVEQPNVRVFTAADVDAHRIDWEGRQISVIDIHNLHDRAKRFVVGVVVKRLFEQKEATGSARPLVFLVLDELNKYAPREGWSPIKEVLLDISERGRSLGIILVGAQQTASEVEGRIVANAALRVVGRLDLAEAEKPEYGFLSAAGRGRAGILKPGTMIVQQPEIPTALLVRFPFPAWATRQSEAGPVPVTTGDGRAPPSDPFAGLP